MVEEKLKYKRILTVGDHSAQAWNISKGLREMGINATCMRLQPHRYGYPTDYTPNLSSKTEFDRYKNAVLRFIEFGKVIHKYDIFNAWTGTLITPFNIDMNILNKINKPIVATFIGSDVRKTSLAKKYNPFYLDSMEQKKESKVHNKLNTISELIDVAVIQYPELEPYVRDHFDKVHHIQRTVPVDDVEVNIPENNTNPFIVHAPSNQHIKGTDSVLNAIEELKGEYSFRFELINGMSNQEVKQRLIEADLVIDQLRLGTFGVISLEAMARGTPSVAYIRSDLREKHPDDLPIICANPDTIKTQLIKILENEIDLPEVAKKSRNYVYRHHERSIVAQRWKRLYETLL